MTLSQLGIYFFIAISFCLIIFFVLLFRGKKEEQYETEKKVEEQKQIDSENQKEKNELKESMETGNASADFERSINILHDLASEQRRRDNP